jgi:hypothetical protein
VQLNPIREGSGDIIQGVGATWVPREEDLIQRCKVPESLLLELSELGPQLAEVLGDIHPLSLGEFKEAIDLLLKFDHVPFELEVRCVAQRALGWRGEWTYETGYWAISILTTTPSGGEGIGSSYRLEGLSRKSPGLTSPQLASSPSVVGNEVLSIGGCKGLEDRHLLIEGGGDREE